MDAELSIKRMVVLLALVLPLLALQASAQMKMSPGASMGDSQPVPPVQAQQGVMQSMSMPDMHMDHHMNLHMKFTGLRPAQAEDQERADAILQTLRGSLEKYKDYHATLDDGYHIFLPNVPLPMYHFTSNRNAFEAAFRFDAAHPTSLLYKKTASGYDLIGAMYTAPRRFSEDKLNARVPLSIARWHQHVNICIPPRYKLKTADWTEFGPQGSIATQQACAAAGGRFMPVVFGWMVHVYPFEKDPDKIWAH